MLIRFTPGSLKQLYLKQLHTVLSRTKITANKLLTNRCVQRLKANLEQTFIDSFVGHEPAKKL